VNTSRPRNTLAPAVAVREVAGLCPTFTMVARPVESTWVNCRCCCCSEERDGSGCVGVGVGVVGLEEVCVDVGVMFDVPLMDISSLG